ncbi:MAG TPA: hypothetical protein VFT45_25190 [Longimicrobium sp.]|nr:hypothetical protein [Longimicrobium sp.]
MMMQRKIAIVLAAAFAAAIPAAAAAQQALGPSADVSFGIFAGAGGSFVDRGGPALDGIVAIPLGRMGSNTLVAGVTGGISGPLMIGDNICRLGPGDTCVPDYPTFTTAGVAAGVQRTIGAGLSARALAGPAYFHAMDGDDALGLQGRLDVARPLIFHTAVVASVRGSLLPSYQGETLSFATFGVGLRIQ